MGMLIMVGVDFVVFFDLICLLLVFLYVVWCFFSYFWYLLCYGCVMYLVNGVVLVVCLVKFVEVLGVCLIELVLVCELLLCDGKVVGVLVESVEGFLCIEVGVVVLVCGGFFYDLQCCVELVFILDILLLLLLLGCNGDGLCLGESVGGWVVDDLCLLIVWVLVL